MPLVPMVPYRTLLLASVAAFAVAGDAAAQTISTPTAGPVVVTVGTPLVVTGAGSITGAGANDGVTIGVASPSVSNSGVIQATGSGMGIHVASGGNLSLLTNAGSIQQTAGNGTSVGIDLGGTIGTLNNVSTGNIGLGGASAIYVGGQLGTLTNSGVLGDPNASNSRGVYLGPNGTINSIVNNPGGQIVSGGSYPALALFGSVGSVTNAAGGTIASNGAYGIGILIARQATSVTNAGFIQANGYAGYGIEILRATVGVVTNTGTIEANGDGYRPRSYYGTGIRVSNSQVNTLTNSGTITANGSYGMGIRVVNSYVTSLGNTGLIQANGIYGGTGGIGIAVQTTYYGKGGTQLGNAARGRASRLGYYTYVGTLTNSGTILSNGTGGVGIAISSYRYSSFGGSGASNVVRTRMGPSYYTTVGTLTNSGIIRANGFGGTGILVQGAGVGSLGNSGLIQANGGYGIGIKVTYSYGNRGAQSYYPTLGRVGTLTNSGTIQANGSGNTSTSFGIAVQGGAIYSMVNSGLIQANGNRSNGIRVFGVAHYGPASGYSAIYSLTNSGRIEANGTKSTAILVYGGLIGTITNSGQIVANDPSGEGIYVGGGGAVFSIVNTAGGIIRGGYAAIDNRYSGHSVSIVNAGQIVGNILFGQYSDSLTITGGGTVAGNIYGFSGAGNSVTFNTNVPYTLNNVIQNVDSITVQGGTVTIQQFGSVTTPIQAAYSFNIAPAGTVQFNSGTIQARSFVNQGMLNIGTGTPTIDTTPVQNLQSRPGTASGFGLSAQFTSTGQFGVGVMSPTTNGLLTVIGSANVGGSVIVATPTAAAQALTLLNQTFTVLTATSLTAPVAGTTAGSSTPNPAVIFTVGQNGNNLTLTARINPVTNLLPSGTPYNLLEADFGFAGLANRLLAANDLTDYGKLIAPFVGGIFTTQQQISIMTKLEASLVGANIVSTNSILSLEGAATQALLNHQTAMRQTDGMAAGDEVGRGYQVWIQPFGSFQTQNSTIGFYATDASTANSYGVVAGGDTLVRPDLRVGLALTLGNTDITYAGNLTGNKASVLTTQLALYATWYQGHWFVDGTAGFGLDWFTTHESELAYGGSRDAGFNGTHVSARIGTGYDWQVGSRLTITPYAALQDTHYNIGGYTTHGLGLLDLTVANKAFDTLESRIGAKAAYSINYGAYRYTPELHTYYLHNFGANQALTTTESFVGGGPNFFTRGPARDRDVFNVGFGLTVAKIGRVTVTGTYDYFGGASSSDHQLSARFNTDF